MKAAFAWFASVALGCGGHPFTSAAADGGGSPTSDGAPPGAQLPLVLVADVPLPGGATRFDYQELDPAKGHLVIAHMDDNAVVIVNLSDGSPVKVLPGIPVARGIAVADSVGRIFVTSSPSSVFIIDNAALAQVGQLTTGNAPDGIAWDPTHEVVGVSDQKDGALSLIAGAGNGLRTPVPLGSETGNVVFDATRGWFWITVVGGGQLNRLVAVDPSTATAPASIDLPGCSGAHGLRLHPDARSAFVACEKNNVLVRVDLEGASVMGTAPTGVTPDVLSIDVDLGWIYVAAESGDLTVFDIDRPGVVLVGHDAPGSSSHTVAVDPATHRVFFPLVSGANGSPVLRIMKPGGI